MNLLFDFLKPLPEEKEYYFQDEHVYANRYRILLIPGMKLYRYYMHLQGD